ncbi:MAG: metal ABC transporter substrate-binding protein [Clostridia bacterium]|nr:metal ABC transporter substrate-binding protein [Clostridia bacterium]
MKKRIIVFCTFIILICICLSACGNINNASNKKNIVVTIYPEYEWVTNLIKGVEDEYNLVWLNQKGIDYHSYSPSVSDMTKISTADIFIYVGGESDSWVEKALKNESKETRTTINLMDVLSNSLYEEETQEHMDSEEENEEEEEVEYDEHIWLSLKNAKRCCKAICDALTTFDEKNKTVFETNYATYAGKIDVLDSKYEEAVGNATKSCVIFGDRFPFLYMFKDYDIRYYAAFVGCSTETTASVKTISTLIQQTMDNNIEYIAVIETYESLGTNVADTIINECASKGYTIKGKVTFDSMQTKSNSDLDKCTYLSIMEKNYTQLKIVLGIE